MSGLFPAWVPCAVTITLLIPDFLLPANAGTRGRLANAGFCVLLGIHWWMHHQHPVSWLLFTVGVYHVLLAVVEASSRRRHTLTTKGTPTS